MRRFLILCGAVGLLLAGQAVYANTDSIRNAMAFPVELLINDKKVEIPADYETLNYDGHAYFPIRLLADATEAGIAYDHEKNRIRYTQFPSTVIARYNNSSTVGDFTVSIHADKQAYTPDEDMWIWAEFQYTGKTAHTLHHGAPLLTFTIRNANGQVWEGARYSNLEETEVEQGTVLRVNLEPKLLEVCHYTFSGSDSLEQFLNETSYPSRLPPGEYEISAAVQFKSSGSPYELASSLQIKIE